MAEEQPDERGLVKFEKLTDGLFRRDMVVLHFVLHFQTEIQRRTSLSEACLSGGIPVFHRKRLDQLVRAKAETKLLNPVQYLSVMDVLGLLFLASWVSW